MSYQKSGKYACFEFEKKFLIAGLPETLIGSKDYIQIEDRYFPSTNLRLRIVSSPGGFITFRKLTQKYVANGADLSKTCITNIYLTEAETSFLDELQGASIKKLRYKLSCDKYDFSVDEFKEPIDNFILAEIEFENEEEMRNFVCPFLEWKDVSLDSKYSGGSLALMHSSYA